jgi:hypothetical protein
MTQLRRIGVGIGATLLLAVSFRLLDLLSAASQALQVDIAAAFARSDVPNLADDLVFEHHAPSLCCDDFIRGGQLVLLVVLMSGLPMALAGLAVAYATWRRSPRPWPRSMGVLLRAGFVVQWSGFMLSALLTVAFLWIDWRATLASWQGLFVLLTMTMSALALPAWQVAAVSTAHQGPGSESGFGLRTGAMRSRKID